MMNILKVDYPKSNNGELRVSFLFNSALPAFTQDCHHGKVSIQQSYLEQLEYYSVEVHPEEYWFYFVMMPYFKLNFGQLRFS